MRSCFSDKSVVLLWFRLEVIYDCSRSRRSAGKSTPLLIFGCFTAVGTQGPQTSHIETSLRSDLKSAALVTTQPHGSGAFHRLLSYFRPLTKVPVLPTSCVPLLMQPDDANTHTCSSLPTVPKVYACEKVRGVGVFLNHWGGSGGVLVWISFGFFWSPSLRSICPCQLLCLLQPLTLRPRCRVAVPVAVVASRPALLIRLEACSL